MKKSNHKNSLALEENSKKIFLIVFALLIGVSLFAQQTGGKNNTTVANPNEGLLVIKSTLYYLTIAFIAFELFAIFYLSFIIRLFKNQTKGFNIINTKMILACAALLFSFSVFGQTTAPVADAVADTNTGLMTIDSKVFYFLLAFLVLLLMIVFYLANIIRTLVTKETSAKHPSFGEEKVSMFEKMNASVPLEKEKDILMDHDYDGIKELDNNLPPWWKYGFYVTIIFAVVYLFYYHVAGGDSSITAYNKTMEAARIAKEANPNSINEDNVKLITDKAELAEAEKIFKTTCTPCHGPDGQGVVGPNLTDDYWIHGGSVKNIFRTITNGWPEKGMKSWKTDFSPKQISQLASYVKSLRGTNPPNPKAPQGDLFKEDAVAGTTEAPKKDSAGVNKK